MPLPPIYVADDQIYQVDTCLPQKRAIERGLISVHGLARGNYPGFPLGEDRLEGVSAVGHWDAVGRQDWGLEMHRNEGIELSYLEAGALPFVVDGRRFELQPGELTITRPWQLHGLGDPHIRASRQHWLILDVGVRRPNQPWHWPKWLILEPEDLEELTGLLRLNEHPVWKVGPAMYACFNQLGRLMREEPSPTLYSQTKVAVNQLLIALLEMLRERKINQDPQLTTSQRAVDLFLDDLARNRQNLAELWSLQGMARRCGVSAPTFVHYCKLHTNLSPMAYLTYLRLETASQLLRESPELSVTEIAYQCGFSSSQYFATVFRKSTGRTPKQFRQQGNADWLR